MQDDNVIIDGWARVEVMGHSVHVGKLTTHTLGTAQLFRVESPAIPERDETLAARRYTELGYLPEGSVIRYPAIPAATVLLGVPAIFRITPLTEEQVTRDIIKRGSGTPVLVSKPMEQIEGNDGKACEIEQGVTQHAVLFNVNVPLSDDPADDDDDDDDDDDEEPLY